MSMCKGRASHAVRRISSFGDLEQAWPTFPVKGHRGDHFNTENTVSSANAQFCSYREDAAIDEMSTSERGCVPIKFYYPKGLWAVLSLQTPDLENVKHFL